MNLRLTYHFVTSPPHVPRPEIMKIFEPITSRHLENQTSLKQRTKTKRSLCQFPVPPLSHLPRRFAQTAKISRVESLRALTLWLRPPGKRPLKLLHEQK